MTEGGFLYRRPLIVAALHLAPLPGSQHPNAQNMQTAIDLALRNTAKAVRAGVPAVYIQDVADEPIARTIQPYTIASLAVIGAALRREFPELALGVCMMSHGAREPLAAAQAMGAQFVRLKVYVGVMVKAEGLLEGLAHDAIHYRAQIGAQDIAILADVYDRTGQPLGRMPLVDEARQAAVFGRADGLVLTGASLEESLEMLGQVRQANLGVPLLIGGGATAENIGRVLAVADGAIVSSTFKAESGWTRQSLLAEWDESRMRAFMQAVNTV
jgi:uncharacterized protein